MEPRANATRARGPFCASARGLAAGWDPDDRWCLSSGCGCCRHGASQPLRLRECSAPPASRPPRPQPEFDGAMRHAGHQQPCPAKGRRDAWSHAVYADQSSSLLTRTYVRSRTYQTVWRLHDPAAHLDRLHQGAHEHWVRSRALYAGRDRRYDASRLPRRLPAGELSSQRPADARPADQTAHPSHGLTSGSPALARGAPRRTH